MRTLIVVVLFVGSLFVGACKKDPAPAHDVSHSQ